MLLYSETNCKVIVVDEGYEKDGKRGLFIAGFDTIEEARTFICEQDNPNYVIIDRTRKEG